jgi:hypothetical protein
VNVVTPRLGHVQIFGYPLLHDDMTKRKTGTVRQTPEEVAARHRFELGAPAPNFKENGLLLG